MLHEVVTTEKVRITYRVAGMGSRFLAWLTDCGLIIVLNLMGALAGVALEIVRPGLLMAVVTIWIFILWWGYFLFFEWLWAGQTPGKRLMGIRVVQLQGSGISFYQAAVRNVLRVVDGLPMITLPVPLVIAAVPPLVYGVGFVVAACNRNHRRLGDLAAGTLVVHMESKARAVQPLPEGPPMSDKSLAALVRHRLGQLDRAQQQALLDLCLRRDQLPLHDRARLFRTTAEYFQNLLSLARDEYQSDEKFVLQLATLLGDRAS